MFNILRTLKVVLASTAGRHYLIHETLSCGIVYDSTFGVASNFFYVVSMFYVWLSICSWGIIATDAIKLIHPKLTPCRSVCSVQGSCLHGRYCTIIVWNRLRGESRTNEAGLRQLTHRKCFRKRPPSSVWEPSRLGELFLKPVQFIYCTVFRTTWTNTKSIR